MKYSIITPVYNAELYISECIESVIAQTYSDWELILVDDGSTDKSSQICDEYANKDSRIKVLHVENGGAYKARLFANDYVEGDYTIGLDSDDMYKPNCLEKVEQAIKQSGADMIVFGRTDFECDTNIYKKVEYNYESGRLYSKEEFLEKALINTDHSLWNKAIKSSIYKKAQYIKEEYRLSVSLDYLQELPLLCSINNAYAIRDALYIYRLRDGSISHSVKFSHLIDNDWINDKIRDYLKLKGLYSKNVEYSLEHSYINTMLPRLYLIRWDITSKEKNTIRKMPFLNSMANLCDELSENKVNSKILNYIRKCVMGPKSICYKLFLKYYIKPLERNTTR